ncbi:hypothetical protein Lalb_Chr16g0376651 [Lupinus albus]|uniref:Uncharacterized protein n=1 Tax=Lupinus albus TaxID=3870 RepID=A0A6A4NVZ2_LUPAL|nr:hypothetical protein Lalb_Chr16g0376651 [Lupinus albus]
MEIWSNLSSSNRYMTTKSMYKKHRTLTKYYSSYKFPSPAHYHTLNCILQ